MTQVETQHNLIEDNKRNFATPKPSLHFLYLIIKEKYA